MDNPFKSPAIISFCPGILGLERGLKRAIGKLSVIAYAEIEAFICANIVAGMEEGLLDPAPIWTDVKTFPAHYFRGKVHGIIGGYPCQPFSTAGKQKGADDPRHLFPFIRNHVETTRPVWCFFENVRGHLKLGYSEVYKSLRDLGYAVEPGLYSAEETGAPHRRERLFILAIRTDYLEQIREWPLDNPDSLGFVQPYNEISAGRYAVELSGEKLANSPGECKREQADENNPVSGGRKTRKIVSSGGTEKLANANNNGHPHRQFKINSAERGEHALSKITSGGSEIVADSGSEQFKSSGSTRGGGTEFTNGSELADAEECGVQGLRTEREPESDLQAEQILFRCDSEGIFDRWPARPGQAQFDWEQPRTTKPGLGCTINGYNFREDLLRAYGNSVVEQTAEIAFIDLLYKHWINSIM